MEVSSVVIPVWGAFVFCCGWMIKRLNKADKERLGLQVKVTDLDKRLAVAESSSATKADIEPIKTDIAVMKSTLERIEAKVGN